jgi:ADP-ribose pyrophosphatase YjhB (NUDIX family)
MPILGVNVVIIEENKVLLTKRRDFEVWCLPGGEVEDGESLVQAAMREALEEVGLQVQLERLIGIHSRSQWHMMGGHMAVFAARVIGGELSLQPAEVLEARYFGGDELPMELLLGHRQQALDALAGVCGAVWTHNSEGNFEAGITRDELYRLRDQSGLSPAEFYLTRVAKPLANGNRLEVKRKADVY